MTTLYLVRHGETVDNASHIMQGQTQGELNDTGREQARELAVQMSSEHIDVFVASDLWRAVETCRILSEPYGAEVITTELLRERDWGSFTGRYIPDLKDVEWPDDIETIDALKSRARRFIDFIREKFPEKRVLAVGHGIINKAIQAVFYDKEMKDIAPMRNTEVRQLML